MHRHHAFTLIELLVVISIIALLIAILLPALNAARAQAHLAGCMSNMRQISLAYHTYATEHQDYFPSDVVGEPSPTQKKKGGVGMSDFSEGAIGKPPNLYGFYTAAEFLLPYVNNNYELFIDPAHEMLIRQTLIPIAGEEGVLLFWNYSENHRAMGSLNAPFHRTTEFVTPTKTVMMFEGGIYGMLMNSILNRSTAHSNYFVAGAHDNPSSPSDTMALDQVNGRHPNTGNNMIHPDGHVHTYNARKLGKDYRAGILLSTDPMFHRN